MNRDQLDYRWRTHECYNTIVLVDVMIFNLYPLFQTAHIHYIYFACETGLAPNFRGHYLQAKAAGDIDRCFNKLPTYVG